jgi:hypothetical protein
MKGGKEVWGGNNKKKKRERNTKGKKGLVLEIKRGYSPKKKKE